MNMEQVIIGNNLIEKEEKRKKRLLYMLLLMSLVVHVLLFIISIFLHKPVTLFLLTFNISLISVYFIFWKREQYTLVLHLLVTSIILHSSAASIILGWESYYAFYLLTGIIIINNSHSISGKIKGIESIFILLIFLFLLFFDKRFHISTSNLSAKDFIGLLNLFAIGFSIFFMLTQTYKENHRLRNYLYEMAEIDVLTNAYNRRFFNNYLSIEKKRLTSIIQYTKSNKDAANFGIAMVDLDDFKSINDTYGHLAGDQVLKETAGIMRDSLFERDLLCRYGGEEFVILYTSTDKTGAMVAIEKIRKTIQNHRFVLNGKTLDRDITVSIGFACFNEEKDLNKLLDLSDKRLYEAKKKGKNCTVAG